MSYGGKAEGGDVEEKVQGGDQPIENELGPIGPLETGAITLQRGQTIDGHSTHEHAPPGDDVRR